MVKIIFFGRLCRRGYNSPYCKCMAILYHSVEGVAYNIIPLKSNNLKNVCYNVISPTPSIGPRLCWVEGPTKCNFT